LGSGDGEFEEIGTWVEGFRPTAIRITYTNTGNYGWVIQDSDGGWVEINDSDPVVSGVAYPITMGSFDIFILWAYANNDSQVTNIEFFG
jgi:hypothetical protein